MKIRHFESIYGPQGNKRIFCLLQELKIVQQQHQDPQKQLIAF